MQCVKECKGNENALKCNALAVMCPSVNWKASLEKFFTGSHSQWQQ